MNNQPPSDDSATKVADASTISVEITGHPKNAKTGVTFGQTTAPIEAICPRLTLHSVDEDSLKIPLGNSITKPLDDDPNSPLAQFLKTAGTDDIIAQINCFIQQEQLNKKDNIAVLYYPRIHPVGQIDPPLYQGMTPGMAYDIVSPPSIDFKHKLTSENAAMATTSNTPQSTSNIPLIPVRLPAINNESPLSQFVQELKSDVTGLTTADYRRAIQHVLIALRSLQRVDPEFLYITDNNFRNLLHRAFKEFCVAEPSTDALNEGYSLQWENIAQQQLGIIDLVKINKSMGSPIFDRFIALVRHTAVLALPLFDQLNQHPEILLRHLFTGKGQDVQNLAKIRELVVRLAQFHQHRAIIIRDNDNFSVDPTFESLSKDVRQVQYCLDDELAKPPAIPNVIFVTYEAIMLALGIRI